jgi:hypothetical protein
VLISFDFKNLKVKKKVLKPKKDTGVKHYSYSFKEVGKPYLQALLPQPVPYLGKMPSELLSMIWLK